MNLFKFKNKISIKIIKIMIKLIKNQLNKYKNKKRLLIHLLKQQILPY